MRILHINSFDRWGGAEQLAYDLALATSAEAEVKMLVGEKYREDDWIDTLAPKGISRIASKLTGTEQRFTYNALSSHPWYKEADVVHLHNLHSGNDYFDLGALEPIANEKPVVWTLHDMWAVTGGEAYTFDHEGYKTGDAQTPYGHIYPLSPQRPDTRAEQMALKKEIYGRTKGRITFVPNSKWTTTVANDAWVNEGNMDVQPIINGVDPKVFNYEGVRNWERPRILFFNSDSPFKGASTAVEALRQITGSEITCVGEGISGLPTRQLPPLSDRNELASLYNQHDILVFPSLAESFGLVVAEAKACGMCVIGSDTGGVTEQLEGGKGMLFPVSDSKALLGQLQEATGNLEATRSIGREAARDVAENYSAAAMVEKYLELYRAHSG